MGRFQVFCLLLVLAFELTVGYYAPRKEVGELLKTEYSRFDRRKPFEMGLGYYYQGDIILKPAMSKAAIKNPVQRWPNGIVPYEFDANYSLAERMIVEYAFEQYANKTCVRFVPHEDQPFYITITKEETGCYSYVGFQEDNQYHNVNLQSPECLYGAGTSVHELLHALGAFHEFTRPDRDDWVAINRSALKEEYQTEEFFNNNFAVLPADLVTSYNIPYDYQSVMHYSKYAGAADPEYPVMMNKKPFFGDFGNKAGLIQSDVDLVNFMYCGEEA